MIGRRRVFFAAPLLAAAGPAFAQSPQCAVVTKSRQAAMTPDEALQALKDGNARFVAGKSVNCDLLAQVRDTSTFQAPIAAIVGCIDSRVPPELVFDQTIGDIFAARVAGNFVNTDIIGSLEFATKLSGAKLIVVLGHSECGAIKGAVDHAKLGNLTATLRNIEPAVRAARDVPGERNSSNKALVQAVADANVRIAARNLIARSQVLRDLVAAKSLRIATAMHDITTGRITFFS